MSFWGGVRNFLLELVDDVPLEEQSVVRWSTVEGKFAQVLGYTRQQVPNRSDIRQATTLLSELMSVIERQKFQFGRDIQQFQEVRTVLLDLWSRLLHYCKLYSQIISRKYARDKMAQDRNSGVETHDDLHGILSSADVEIFHRVINHLMVRKEFNIEYLQLDKTTGAPKCSEVDLLVAYRYRVLLYNTQEYAQNMLNFHVAYEKVGNRPMFEFLAKVFAVNCFRLPKVLSLIQSAIGLTEEQNAQIEEYLLDQSLKLPKQHDDRYFTSSNGTGGKKGSLRRSNDSVLTTYELPDLEAAEAERLRDLPAEVIPKSAIIYSQTGGESEQSGGSGAGAAAAGGNNNNLGNTSAIDNNNLLLPLTPARERIATATGYPPDSPQYRVLTMVERFPNLFRWQNAHSAILMHVQSDNEDDKLVGGDWLEEFKKRGILFFVFIDQWVKHVRLITRKQFFQLDWQTLKGYRTIVPSFIYAMKTAPHFIKDLQDCSCTLLLTDTNLLNFYLHHLFSQTSVFNVFDTQNTIVYTEAWFKTLTENKLTLTPEFDHKFFCKGIETMFHSDHHQIMSRALSLLYHALDCFVGDARVALVIDLLLHRYFYKLFLHWDSSVRNCYHQLLLFKAVRVKRSRLVNMKIMAETGVDNIADTVVYSKIESYIRMLEDQVRPDLKRTQKDYPKELEVYTPKAIEEFNAYKRLYQQWEKSDNVQAPKLIPYAMLPHDIRKRRT